MSVTVNGIYYVHACEQACWARSAVNSAIENVCIIIIIIWSLPQTLNTQVTHATVRSVFPDPGHTSHASEINHLKSFPDPGHTSHASKMNHLKSFPDPRHTSQASKMNPLKSFPDPRHTSHASEMNHLKSFPDPGHTSPTCWRLRSSHLSQTHLSHAHETMRLCSHQSTMPKWNRHTHHDNKLLMLVGFTGFHCHSHNLKTVQLQKRQKNIRPRRQRSICNSLLSHSD